MFLSFISNSLKEFEEKFQDFAKTDKLSKFFKSSSEVAPAAEWTDVAAKLSSLYFEWRYYTSKNIFPCKCIKMHSLIYSEANMSQKTRKNAKN